MCSCMYNVHVYTMWLAVIHVFHQLTKLLPLDCSFVIPDTIPVVKGNLKVSAHLWKARNLRELHAY